MKDNAVFARLRLPLAVGGAALLGSLAIGFASGVALPVVFIRGAVFFIFFGLLVFAGRAVIRRYLSDFFAPPVPLAGAEGAAVEKDAAAGKETGRLVNITLGDDAEDAAPEEGAEKNASLPLDQEAEGEYTEPDENGGVDETDENDEKNPLSMEALSRDLLGSGGGAPSGGGIPGRVDFDSAITRESEGKGDQGVDLGSRYKPQEMASAIQNILKQEDKG